MLVRVVFFCLNKIIALIGVILNVLFLALPPSAFNFIQKTEYADFIGKINYWLPIAEFTVIIESWLVAIAIFYLYSIYGRWIKAIQ